MVRQILIIIALYQSVVNNFEITEGRISEIAGFILKV